MTRHYQEPEKIKARDLSLSFAVESLTTNRHNVTIARENYVQEVKDFLIKNGSPADIHFASQLDDSEAEHWNKFYLSIVGYKTPSDLRVAYLSGANPENDVEVLVKLGILPENIWAFESDNTTYSNATISALESRFRFIKIYKGRIENILKLLPFKFDIVYLDFCKTLISKKTITVIKDVFLNNKLNSPGALITNFALPEDTDSNREYRKKINLFAANYIYPKTFTEVFEEMGGGFIESPECCGISSDEFLKLAANNQENLYSQLITRMLYDIPSVILPYQKLAKNPIIHNYFFKKFNNSSFDEDYTEDLWTFPNDNSQIWGLSNFWVYDQNLTETLSSVNKQLSLSGDEGALIDNLQLSHYFLRNYLEEGLHSDKLEIIMNKWKSGSAHIFCDVFLFHQFKDILIGQLTSPYFYSVEFTKRWMYKAKSQKMFVDAIIYDECRYIFDWMPTVDMFDESLDNLERQFSLRFAMDGIAKQRRWYNDEFFSGTAIIDQNTENFEAQELKPREIIT